MRAKSYVGETGQVNEIVELAIVAKGLLTKHRDYAHCGVLSAIA